MKAKRYTQWFIVLFLLTTLPGLMVAIAQEQRPITKQLPVMNAPGESAAPLVWNVTETEPNDSCAEADIVTFGDVISGELSENGDGDYYQVNFSGGKILADIDAESMGSALDSEICLKTNGAAFWDLGCNDDSDGWDSMFYTYAGETGGSVCIQVGDYDGLGGPEWDYQLIVSQPLLISAAANGSQPGSVAGIPFQSEDILAWSDLNTGDEKWVMFFDASNVGITENVWNIASAARGPLGTSQGILLGFAEDQYVADLNSIVTPYDVIEFIPRRYGPLTEGIPGEADFVWAWHGQEHELTDRGEKIDALGRYDSWYSPYQNDNCLGWSISTINSSKVTHNGKNLNFRDEDIACLADDPAWNWFQLLKGSRIPGLAAEDIVALSANSVLGMNDSYNVTIEGGGWIAGQRYVTQKDIFCVQERSGPGPSNGWCGLVWHGPDHGWNYDIDAFDY